MHRFWEIDELVRMLASDLKDRCDASASALALACCSKRLNDIVLDSLWEHLGDLYRLLSCLPPESWELTGDEEFVRTAFSCLPTFGSSLANRFSCDALLLRNGPDSPVMLEGFGHFSRGDQQEFLWRRITSYLCRP